MERIAKFEKVSYERFKKDWMESFTCNLTDKDYDAIVRAIYESIKLPKRATKGSAGYDFYSPCSLVIPEGCSTPKIPTGIRCKMDRGWVLKMYPRSGHGFKFGVHLSNTVGIIDEDYYGSDNEGHIFVELVNDSILAKPIELKSGDAFCQGVFVPFGITVDDEVTEIRNGGFGSTDKS